MTDERQTWGKSVCSLLRICADTSFSIILCTHLPLALNNFPSVLLTKGAPTKAHSPSATADSTAHNSVAASGKVTKINKFKRKKRRNNLDCTMIDAPVNKSDSGKKRQGGSQK